MGGTIQTPEKIIDYARVILEAGKAVGEVDLLEIELKSLKDEITSNLDLKKYLTEPSIILSDKIKASLNMLEDGASPAIKAAMAMIVILGLVEDIGRIYNAFTELVNDFRKQVYVEVISAVELDEGTMGKIKEDVDRASALDVRIRNTVDRSIIGGLIINIGEKVIDLSVRNKMEDIKTKLKSVKLGGEGFGTED
ncbi:MAG TPA: ATP synthase F1 subunit delta [Actinobacteria bacterium]|nr:ATP synthase F1 subunit delta [Actinomycetota bacterium]